MSTSLKVIDQISLDLLVGNRTSLNREQNHRLIADKDIHASLVLMVQENRNPGVYIIDLYFKNCIFRKEVKIGQPFIAGIVKFENCTFEEEVVFTSVDNIELIGESFFKNNLTLSPGSNPEFTISDIAVDGTLKITSDRPVKLFVKNINVDKKLENQKLIVDAMAAEIDIDNVNCLIFNVKRVAKGNVTNIFSNIRCDKFNLVGPWSNSKIEIETSSFKNLIIENISNDANKLILSDCNIEIFSIPLSEFNEIDISRCIFEFLVFKDTNLVDNIINVQNISIRTQLRFDKILNKGLINLRELKINPGCGVGIFSSNLGNTDFINCDFSNAYFEFENSKVTEVFLSETNFPGKAFLNLEFNPAQSQLAFGQLATAYSKQGDTVKALDYQAREIEAHYHGLKFNSRDFFNTLNLWLNKWSNNFGRYWQLGILFSFSVGVLFFYALVISTTEYKIGWSLDLNERLFSGFLKFMNPLRFLDTDTLFKFKEERPLSLNGWSYFWDFVGRIFVAYGFYQTIQAFRRFGRK